MRVRGSAGAASFRRGNRLEACLVEAQEQLEWVKKNGAEWTAREQAAQERAARERLKRIEEAVKQLPEIEARRLHQRKMKPGKGEARVSTTDPDCRVQKCGDGGYRPGYNFQFATDGEEDCVVGVRVTNSPADSEQLSPMLEDIRQRCGKVPAEYLADAGYTSAANVEAAERAGTTLYGPVLTRPQSVDDRFMPRRDDSASMVSFRLRMGSDEGKEAYKERAPLAEKTNANAKERFGLRGGVLVRGIAKVTCIALWVALAINVDRILSMGIL
jgi:hypothetical protein